MPGTTVVETPLVGGALAGGALHRMAAEGTSDLQTIADVDGICEAVLLQIVPPGASTDHPRVARTEQAAHV